MKSILKNKIDFWLDSSVCKCIRSATLSSIHMLINYMYSHCGESCCLMSAMCTDGSAVTSTAVSLCCKHPNVTQTVVWVNLSSLEWKKSVSAHIFILFIFRKGWLDWAKTDFEITAGPYRAGRAVFQLWGYHYSVAGCQGKVSVLRSLSSDASHMYYDCEAQQ